MAGYRTLGALIAWFRIDPDNPEIAVAQLFQLRRQVPFLYALLMVNAAAVAYTHYGLAPDGLTVGVLVPLLVVCGIRLVGWIRLPAERVAPALAIRQLRRTIVLSTVLALAFVSWAICLDGYGGPAERGHVALFIAITVIACIFCLTHLPQAALLVTGLVTVPYVWHYLLSGSSVFHAIAINIVLVSIVMIKVLMSNFRAFVQLEASRSELASKQVEAESLSEANAVLANTDSLTGLPNRRYFFQHLETMLAAARETEAPFALGIFDLDEFKPVNDTYGHAVGDRVLIETAARLKRLAGKGIVIARLGGDEFAILLTGDVGEDRVSAFGQRLCRALGRPLLIDGIRISPGCSCGLVLYPAAGDSANLLFDRADYALYHSKTHARGTATVFSLGHETTIRLEHAIENALQGADLEAELDVHFQPVVDIGSGLDVAMEALARWTSPVLGPVSPQSFIAVAERTNRIHALTLCLLRKSLAHALAWPEQLGLSFNLSARDITSPETVLAIIAAVRASGVSPRRLTFELTETAVLQDFDLASQSVGVLRAFGCRIALDDFGTGYSSLGHVHRLPLDQIKIDRSFLIDIANRVEGRSIVRTTLGLCRELHLDCVAEGAERAEDIDLLRDLGCRHVQGYHLGRPMPASDVLARIGREMEASGAVRRSA